MREQMKSQRESYAPRKRAFRFLLSCGAAVFMLLLATTLTSCQDSETKKAEKELKSEIKEANKEFPEEIAPGLVMTKLRIDGDYVVCDVECDEDLMDIDILNSNKEVLKNSVEKSLIYGDSSDTYYLKLCAKANKGITYRLVGDTTGKTCEVSFSYSELQEMIGDNTSSSADSEDVEDVEEEAPSYESKEQKAERFLKAAVESANKNYCPQEVFSGVVVTEVRIEGDYVVYVAECDEDLIDIDILNSNKGDVKSGIEEDLFSDDPSTTYLRELCVKAHKGIAYRYVGDTTGKTCVVYFSYSDLLQQEDDDD